MADDLVVFVLHGLDVVFGLVEQTEGGVSRAVGAHGDDVLQPL